MFPRFGAVCGEYETFVGVVAGPVCSECGTIIMGGTSKLMLRGVSKVALEGVTGSAIW